MTITNRVVENYLNCRYKAFLTLTGEIGTPHEYEVLLNELALEYRSRATEALLLRCKLEDAPRNPVVTLDLLNQGHPLILDCTVETDQFQFHFDALKKADGKSSLGSWHYEPVMFCHEEKIREHHRLVLACGKYVIDQIQQQTTQTGLFVVGENSRLSRTQLSKPCKKVPKLLEELGQSSDGIVVPDFQLNRHCDVCEFRCRCLTEATEKDDLSLLKGLSNKEIGKLNKRGIFTVTQYSYTFRQRRSRKGGTKVTEKHAHALQARALREKTIYVAQTPSLPSSATRLYLDVEGLPHRYFYYLIGLKIVDSGTGPRDTISLWADTEKDEGSLWVDLLRILGDIGSFTLFHYGSYDSNFLRQMKKRYGGDDEFVEHVHTSCCNVLSAIHSHIYFPTYSNGLKEIAAHLGFRWSVDNPSGLQSIVWRHQWEKTGDEAVKQRLIAYNRDDCCALEHVVRCLSHISGEPSEAAFDPVTQIVSTEDMRPDLPFHLGDPGFVTPELAEINARAHFDYQRNKVYLRTNKKAGKIVQRGHRPHRKHYRINKVVEISKPDRCPKCGASSMRNRKKHSREVLDLKISGSGVKRWVTTYRCRSYVCRACNAVLFPEEFKAIAETKYGATLSRWVAFKTVALRQTNEHIVDELFDVFGFSFRPGLVSALKRYVAQFHATTYARLLTDLRNSRLIHADETWVLVRGQPGKCYVWAFADMERVVYLYSRTREAKVAEQALDGFRGVLVSDFYAGYDSLKCPQQKCLIHLMRDVNGDVLRYPFDEELRGFVQEFGRLLRNIVETIDRYGLKRRNLRKRREDVQRFYCHTLNREFGSEIAEHYRQRMIRYREKLFTFLEYDGVPWNNNNAENAIKLFVARRRIVGTAFSEKGIQDFLSLLSIYQTLRYRKHSFLKFLLSGATDVDAFCG